MRTRVLSCCAPTAGGVRSQRAPGARASAGARGRAHLEEERVLGEGLQGGRRNGTRRAERQQRQDAEKQAGQRERQHFLARRACGACGISACRVRPAASSGRARSRPAPTPMPRVPRRPPSVRAAAGSPMPLSQRPASRRARLRATERGGAARAGRGPVRTRKRPRARARRGRVIPGAIPPACAANPTPHTRHTGARHTEHTRRAEVEGRYDPHPTCRAGRGARLRHTARDEFHTAVTQSWDNSVAAPNCHTLVPSPGRYSTPLEAKPAHRAALSCHGPVKKFWNYGSWASSHVLDGFKEEEQAHRHPVGGPSLCSAARSGSRWRSPARSRP